MSNLLDRLGGEAAITAVVDSFYDKVFADKTLAPFFANTDFAKQRLRQKKFLIQLMSGQAKDPATYMRNAHRKYVNDMGLNDSHFDIVATHLISTLREFKVPDALITEVGGALESLRGPVLDKPPQKAA